MRDVIVLGTMDSGLKELSARGTALHGRLLDLFCSENPAADSEEPRKAVSLLAVPLRLPLD